MRIAIIDHDNHELYVEDINQSIFDNQYGGDEQAYIDDNYNLVNYSWDYIVDATYISADVSEDAIEIKFNKLR